MEIDPTQNTVEKESKPWQFQKGGDPRRNNNGRPPGALNFKTKWLKLIDKLAAENNITADDVEMQLLLTGFKKAKQGDFRFIKDIWDRVYGKPLQEVDVTTNGRDIVPTDAETQALVDRAIDRVLHGNKGDTKQ